MMLPLGYSIKRLRDLREQCKISHKRLREAKIRLNAENKLNMWKPGQLVTVNGIVCRVKKYDDDICPCISCAFFHGTSREEFPCVDCQNLCIITKGKNKLQPGHYLQRLCTSQVN